MEKNIKTRKQRISVTSETYIIAESSSNTTLSNSSGNITLNLRS